jgi:hypothetical protein
MKNHRVFAASSLVLVAMLLLTGCPQGTTVNQLLADPGKYQDKEVGIRGTVTDSWGALGKGAFQVDDGTGKIWVITDHGVPAKGAKIGVAGRLTTSAVTVAGKSYALTLNETRRRKG